MCGARDSGFLRLLGFAMLLMSAGPAGAQDSSPLETATQRWQSTAGIFDVRLIEFERPDRTSLRYEIRITSAADGTRSVELGRGHDPKVSVWASQLISVILDDEVYIVDIAAAQLLDNFFGDVMNVSPDGRYVSFTVESPRPFEVRPSIYLLYDVSGTPATNHMESAPTFGMTAGIAVYPEFNRQLQTYESSPSELNVVKFYPKWLDNTHLVLADCAISLPDKSSVSLQVVVVDVSNGLTAVDVRAVPVPVGDIVVPAKAQEGFPLETQLLIDDIVADQISPAGYVLTIKFAKGLAVAAATERQVVL